jgi:hypothetical protein
MMSTRELLRKIQGCPSMYLGRPSARTLHAFLSGFELARRESDPEAYRFSNDFGVWVHKKYNVHSSQNWSKIIEFYCLTEADEMELFWKLFDEFEAKSTRKPRRASSTRAAAAGA